MSGAELRALCSPSWPRGHSAIQSALSVVVGGSGPEKSITLWVCFPVPSRVVCVCVFKNPARRGMILLLPRVHRTGINDCVIKLRADGPLQPPQPRNFVGTRGSFEFRAFPGSPKHKDPKGSRTACADKVSGGLGLQVTYRKVHHHDGSKPHRRQWALMAAFLAISNTLCVVDCKEGVGI